MLLATLQRISYTIKEETLEHPSPLYFSLSPTSFKVWDSQNAPPAAKQAVSLSSWIFDENVKNNTGYQPIRLFLKSPMMSSSLVFSKALILNPGCILSPGQLKNAPASILPIGCFIWVSGVRPHRLFFIPPRVGLAWERVLKGQQQQHNLETSLEMRILGHTPHLLHQNPWDFIQPSHPGFSSRSRWLPGVLRFEHHCF